MSGIMRGVKQRMDSAGFTMIELLVAMTVFSFMLMIIVVGFMNVVRLHNSALASNMAQDNARTAIDELVRAVRDSATVIAPTTVNTASGTLCLASAKGVQQVYYLNAGVLTRADDCTTKTNPVAITSSSVSVTNFAATLRTGGPAIVKPEVELTVTVGSANGTTTGSGANIKCGPTNAEREFCSVVTLTSGAVPR
jgi:prepilin-type N-terminal cleavage/methylation domain-containing protein